MPDFGRWNAGGGDPSLNEINRTDQFLDALATQDQPYATDHGEAELAQLLAGWRDDVRETPMGHVLTTEQAAAALDRVTRPAPKRRFPLAVVGSAAAAVLAIGGVGAVVAGSGPGDALYGLRTMLFGEQTQPRDDAVILAAQTEMQQVQQLIEQGDWQGAQDKLEAVTTTVATVDDVARKEELIEQWQELTVKVEAQNPVATVPPGAPLPTFPEVVVDPAVTVPSGPSETTTPPSSETTPPSGSATPSESATPSQSGAPSSTPAPSSTLAPTTTAAPSPTSIPPSVTTSAVPSPTSTTVIMQSSTTRPPQSTPPAVPAPSPTPVPTPLPTTTIEFSGDDVVEDEVVVLPTPTTTTPMALPIPQVQLPAQLPVVAVPALPAAPALPGRPALPAPAQQAPGQTR